jgi:hypothetical protein
MPRRVRVLLAIPPTVVTACVLLNVVDRLAPHLIDRVGRLLDAAAAHLDKET